MSKVLKPLLNNTTRPSTALSTEGDWADTQALCDYAIELKRSARYAEAKLAFQRITELNPESSDAWSNLSSAFIDIGEFVSAIEAGSKAVELNPNSPFARVNLGAAQSMCGEFDQAIANLEFCLQLAPDFPDAHWNLSRVLLILGAFESGWNEYDWRPSRRGLDGRPTPLPDLNIVRAVRITQEQGYGDALQFARYLPMLASTGVHVAFACPEPLMDLFQQSFGQNVHLVSERAPKWPMPEMPLLSLAQAFGTEIDSVPNAVPYIKVSPEKRDEWRNIINNVRSKSGDTDRAAVGISWAGNHAQINDRYRSISLNTLLDEIHTTGVTLFSLQKDASPDELALLQSHGVVDIGTMFGSFHDTAAAISELDLVIGVDASAIHVAGALNKPVWALLSASTDWRWLLDTDASPWYPSMRIMRQTNLGDWSPVCSEVTLRLQQLSRHKRGRFQDVLDQLGIAIDTNDAEDILDALRHICASFPGDHDVCNALGHVFWRRGRIAQAVEHFIHAYSLCPSDRNTVLNCIRVTRELGAIQDAMTIANIYLGQHPRDIELIHLVQTLASQSLDTNLTLEDARTSTV